MAAVVFRTQATGLRPRSDYVVRHARRALRSSQPTEHLSPRARTVNERELRTFVCRWPRTNRGQKAMLLAAWRDSRGGVLPMDYTPVGKADVDAVEVQFVGPPTMRVVGPGEYELGCELVEVR